MDAAGGGLGDDAALAELRDVLAALSATAPRLVFRKKLAISDVDPHQGRLLVNGPKPRPRQDGAFADASALAADENAIARGDDLVGPRKAEVRSNYPYGRRSPAEMAVPAYDRHGRRFDMRLQFTRSIRSYRFVGEWMRFVMDNQLVEGMEIELWAFRSPELMLESQVEEAGHHVDGALGMAILIRN